MSRGKKKLKAAVPVADAKNNDAAARRQLYDETYGELVKKQMSNSENFDKAILTLSSSGLGLSLAFIKDFVPMESASAKPMLLFSWLMFTAAILSTVGSYHTSQEAIDVQLKTAEDYYIREDAGALQRENPFASATLRLNKAAGIAFTIAIALTMLFVTYNLSK